MQSYNLQGGSTLLPESKRYLNFKFMLSYDYHVLLAEIKADQAKILAQLNDLFKDQSQPKIYDLVQLQQILHVSKRTIATWLKQGILPHSRVGGKIWVTEDQLTEFLQNNSNAPFKFRESKRQKGVTVHE